MAEPRFTASTRHRHRPARQQPRRLLHLAGKAGRSCRSNATPTAIRASPDGTTRRVKQFKDGKGRIKRQAARFQIFVYDDDRPRGPPAEDRRPCRGRRQSRQAGRHPVARPPRQQEGGHGTTFDGLRGEPAIPPVTPLRNAGITDPIERQQLIIDPGPAGRRLHRRGARRASAATATRPMPPTSRRPAWRPTTSTRWAR